MHGINNSERGGTAAATRDNIFFIVVGWAAAILSLLIYPFIFGMIGVISGILAAKNGGKSGIVLIAASIIFMAAGLIFSDALIYHARRYLGV